jgi:hypothetical protein
MCSSNLWRIFDIPPDRPAHCLPGAGDYWGCTTNLATSLTSSRRDCEVCAKPQSVGHSGEGRALDEFHAPLRTTLGIRSEAGKSRRTVSTCDLRDWMQSRSYASGAPPDGGRIRSHAVVRESPAHHLEKLEAAQRELIELLSFSFNDATSLLSLI